jgi:hypothetical protein
MIGWAKAVRHVDADPEGAYRITRSGSGGVEDPEKPATGILRATLVGWITDHSRPAESPDQLVAFNLVGSTRRVSRTKVVKPDYAFLR